MKADQPRLRVVQNEEKIVVIGFGNRDATGNAQRVDDLRKSVGMPDHEHISSRGFEFGAKGPEIIRRDHFRADAQRFGEWRRRLLGTLVFRSENGGEFRVF